MVSSHVLLEGKYSILLSSGFCYFYRNISWLSNLFEDNLFFFVFPFLFLSFSKLPQWPILIAFGFHQLYYNVLSVAFFLFFSAWSSFHLQFFISHYLIKYCVCSFFLSFSSPSNHMLNFLTASDIPLIQLCIFHLFIFLCFILNIFFWPMC